MLNSHFWFVHLCHCYVFLDLLMPQTLFPSLNCSLQTWPPWTRASRASYCLLHLFCPQSEASWRHLFITISISAFITLDVNGFIQTASNEHKQKNQRHKILTEMGYTGYCAHMLKADLYFCVGPTLSLQHSLMCTSPKV